MQLFALAQILQYLVFLWSPSLTVRTPCIRSPNTHSSPFCPTFWMCSSCWRLPTTQLRSWGNNQFSLLDSLYQGPYELCLVSTSIRLDLSGASVWVNTLHRKNLGRSRRLFDTRFPLLIWTFEANIILIHSISVIFSLLCSNYQLKDLSSAQNAKLVRLVNNYLELFLQGLFWARLEAYHWLAAVEGGCLVFTLIRLRYFIIRVISSSCHPGLRTSGMDFECFRRELELWYFEQVAVGFTEHTMQEVLA